MVRAGRLHVVHVDRRAHSSTCDERYVKRFECVGLRAPLLEPGFHWVEVGLVTYSGSAGGQTGGRWHRIHIFLRNGELES
jgi:hypothetical protein